ncbi:hypothetical protein GP486_000976 [Trichoglossum hirsutum]|uniref:NAA35-like N-terminal domain-containing protein n=1 Tax=Trichoglossum hirsutum TaxID=265104 RepID=A0A9P8RT15_9PEZI|nr:hypothetical protein GP486_000976 [Trichoglossum hirsutum]
MVTGGEDSIAIDDAGTAELTIDDDKATAVATNTTSTEVKVRDITSQFKDASSGPSQMVTSLSGPADTLHYHVALRTGQLVKDNFFTLFEAVGALEIMDPKMDNGYLAPGETLEDEYDITKPLLPHEIIGIMDQLLCHEVVTSLPLPTLSARRN